MKETVPVIYTNLVLVCKFSDTFHFRIITINLYLHSTKAASELHSFEVLLMPTAQVSLTALNTFS